MASRIQAHYSWDEVISLPVADGGEGSVDAFLAVVGGRKVFTQAKGPCMEDREVFYGVVDSHVAVIEMTACAACPWWKMTNILKRRSPMALVS